MFDTTTRIQPYRTSTSIRNTTRYKHHIQQNTSWIFTKLGPMCSFALSSWRCSAQASNSFFNCAASLASMSWRKALSWTALECQARSKAGALAENLGGKYAKHRKTPNIFKYIQQNSSKLTAFKWKGTIGFQMCFTFCYHCFGTKASRGTSSALFVVGPFPRAFAHRPLRIAWKHQPSQLITLWYKCILLKSAHMVAWPLWPSWQQCPYFSRFAVYDPSNESSKSLKHLALQESSSCCQSSINSLGEPVSLQTVPDQHPEILLSLYETNLKMSQTINV